MSLHARGLWLRYALWPMVTAMLAMLWSGAALGYVVCENFSAGQPNGSADPPNSCLSPAKLADADPLGPRTPLILIHGINPDGVPGYPEYRAWDNLLQYLANDKVVNGSNSILSRFKPYKFEYYSNRYDGQARISVKNIGGTLGKLLVQMDSLDQEFNGKKIAIVAHSMGGLIARSYMEEWSGSDRVQRLITLGTPHHGSPLSSGPAFDATLNLIDGTLLLVVGNIRTFLYGTVEYADGNRFDLHWDNYDAGLPQGRFGANPGLPYNNLLFPNEQNDWLVSLNTFSFLNSKIFAYSGQVDANLFGSDYEKGAYVLADSILAMPSDGAVPVDSALFYDRSGVSLAGATRFQQFRGYDHEAIHDGLSYLGSLDANLFGTIKADLISIPTTPSSVSTPHLSQITPTPVVGSNSEKEFTISGTNLTSGATVRVIWTGGATDHPSGGVFYDSPSQLRFRIVTGTVSDTWSVQVINPDRQVSNPLTFQVTAPVVANTYSLGTGAVNGTITRAPDLPSYPANSQVTLTAKPNPGYVFSGWSGDASGNTNPLAITMDRSKTIVGLFVPAVANGPTITSVDVTPNSGCTNIPAAQWVNIHGSGFSAGAHVILGTNGWAGTASLESTDLSGIPTLIRVCTIASQATQWTAQVVNAGEIYSNVYPFSTAGLTQYSVTTGASPTGFGEASAGGTYAEGTNVTVVAYPYTGYVFADWTENGNYVSSNRSFTFPIHGTRNLIANFVAAVGPTLTGSITVNIVPAGAVTAGAYWRLSGETQWRISGTRALSLPLGSYTVEFNQLSAWNPPPNQTVQIAVGNPDISVTSGDYVQPTVNAPSNLQAVQNSDGSVLLTWTDNSSNEIAFELQQKRLGGGYFLLPWQPPNTVSYTPLSKYAGYFGSVCFRVRAVGGSGEIFSAFSDEVCATPHPLPIDAACYAPVSDGVLGQPIGRIAGGDQQVIALRGDGTVWRWGLDPLSSNAELSPVQIPGLSDITRISMTNLHALALRKDGTVWAWGVNGNGQIGDGTQTNRPTPVQVPGLSGIIEVAAGYAHSMALQSDGTVWAWGDNVRGGLGDGTTNDHPMPMQVPNLTGVTQIAAGNNASFAIGVGGTLLAWGANDQGTLGIGDVQNIAQLTPVTVPGIGSVTAVSARDLYALAIKQDGTVWAWGLNSSGRIGDGTLNSVHTTPFQIPGLQNIVAVSTARVGSHAVDAGGTVWGWGTSTDGSVGDGSVEQQGYGPNGTPTVSIRSPRTQAIALTDVVAITSSLWSTVIAVRANGTVCTWGGNRQGELGDPNRSTLLRHPVAGHVVDPGAVGAFSLVDATPDQFVFTSQTGAPNAPVISNSVTISGIESNATINVSGGEYSINGGSFASMDGVVRAGDTVAVRVIAPATLGATVNAIITIGGVTGSFSVRAVTPTLTVTNASLPAGELGAAYRYALQAEGGAPPYTWSLAGVRRNSLPQGFTLASDGTLAGVPTRARTTSFAIQVTDAAGGSVTRNLSLQVVRGVKLNTRRLASGTVGVLYLATLQATGGISPFVFSLVGGALPPGLTLDSATGGITGTPTTAGTFDFQVRVTSSGGSSNQKALRITIR